MRLGVFSYHIMIQGCIRFLLFCVKTVTVLILDPMVNDYQPFNKAHQGAMYEPIELRIPLHKNLTVSDIQAHVVDEFSLSNV